MGRPVHSEAAACAATVTCCWGLPCEHLPPPTHSCKTICAICWHTFLTPPSPPHTDTQKRAFRCTRTRVHTHMQAVTAPWPPPTLSCSRTSARSLQGGGGSPCACASAFASASSLRCSVQAATHHCATRSGSALRLAASRGETGGRPGAQGRSKGKQALQPEGNGPPRPLDGSPAQLEGAPGRARLSTTVHHAQN